jgi:hypothetical protein
MQRIKDYSMITSPWKTGAERCASAAPESRSVAEAVGRRLQAVVRLGASYGLRLGVPSPAPPTRSPRRVSARAYLMTASARKRNVGGIVTPSASAVFRLTTNWNAARSTGKSAGLAPFRILSTKTAERWHSSRASAP